MDKLLCCFKPKTGDEIYGSYQPPATSGHKEEPVYLNEKLPAAMQGTEKVYYNGVSDLRFSANVGSVVPAFDGDFYSVADAGPNKPAVEEEEAIHGTTAMILQASESQPRFTGETGEPIHGNEYLHLQTSHSQPEFRSRDKQIEEATDDGIIYEACDTIEAPGKAQTRTSTYEIVEGPNFRIKSEITLTSDRTGSTNNGPEYATPKKGRGVKSEPPMVPRNKLPGLCHSQTKINGNDCPDLHQTPEPGLNFQETDDLDIYYIRGEEDNYYNYEANTGNNDNLSNCEDDDVVLAENTVYVS